MQYLWGVEVELVGKCLFVLVRGKALVEGVLAGTISWIGGLHGRERTLCGKAYHGENDNPGQVQLLDNRLGYCRLARARAARHSDNTDVGPWRGVVCSLLDGDMTL